MLGHLPPFDPTSLRRLRRLVQRLASRGMKSVPVEDLVELGDARIPGDLTLDIEATEQLGAPLVIMSPRGSRRLAGLAPRERQVAALIAEGLANKEIADRLGLTLGTVKSYVHGILRKSRLPNRAAVAAALNGGGARLRYDLRRDDTRFQAPLGRLK